MGSGECSAAVHLHMHMHVYVNLAMHTMAKLAFDPTPGASRDAAIAEALAATHASQAGAWSSSSFVEDTATNTVGSNRTWHLHVHVMHSLLCAGERASHIK